MSKNKNILMLRKRLNQMILSGEPIEINPVDKNLMPDNAKWVCFSVMGYARQINVIAAIEPDWDHVSVSCEYSCPDWNEMDQIKDIVWGEDALVVQFHPPKNDDNNPYVNLHPNCLHLWRPHNDHIKLPDEFR